MMKSADALILIICNNISDLISFINSIIWFIFYSCIILTFQDIYAAFRPVFRFISRVFPSSSRDPRIPDTPALNFRVDARDMEIVLEKLGLSRGPLDGPLVDFWGVFETGLEPDFREVMAAFRVFDVNNDGFIDAGELSRVMESLGLAGFSRLDVEKMILAFDEDGDGRIGFEDFVKLMEGSLG
ncbi:calmodulin-like protein 3 [Andrographis paniculata]|uniref:calmodulin-like protein 3 n=1 Tax=Andrographis paniculata TaxID=175694 RepID=UPI0021E875B1|nr:calmodulin-like protein 3 [Andrographis paniculata]